MKRYLAAAALALAIGCGSNDKDTVTTEPVNPQLQIFHDYRNRAMANTEICGDLSEILNEAFFAFTGSHPKGHSLIVSPEEYDEFAEIFNMPSGDESDKVEEGIRYGSGEISGAGISVDDLIVLYPAPDHELLVNCLHEFGHLAYDKDRVIEEEELYSQHIELGGAYEALKINPSLGSGAFVSVLDRLNKYLESENIPKMYVDGLKITLNNIKETSDMKSSFNNINNSTPDQLISQITDVTIEESLGYLIPEIQTIFDQVRDTPESQEKYQTLYNLDEILNILGNPNEDRYINIVKNQVEHTIDYLEDNYHPSIHKKIAILIENLPEDLYILYTQQLSRIEIDAYLAEPPTDYLLERAWDLSMDLHPDIKREYRCRIIDAFIQNGTTDQDTLDYRIYASNCPEKGDNNGQR